MHHLPDRPHVVLQLLPLHRPRQVAHVDAVARRLGHRGAAALVLLVHLHLLHVTHRLAHEGPRGEGLPREGAHGPHLHLAHHLLLLVVHLLVLPAVAPVAAAGGAALAVLKKNSREAGARSVSVKCGRQGVYSYTCHGVRTGPRRLAWRYRARRARIVIQE